MSYTVEKETVTKTNYILFRDGDSIALFSSFDEANKAKHLYQKFKGDGTTDESVWKNESIYQTSEKRKALERVEELEEEVSRIRKDLSDTAKFASECLAKHAKVKTELDELKRVLENIKHLI